LSVIYEVFHVAKRPVAYWMSSSHRLYVPAPIVLPAGVHDLLLAMPPHQAGIGSQEDLEGQSRTS
jgi:hypothetical protein